ncbi:MAG: hypothetical protein SVX43_01580 [Cyanobacteriota bacterium]|nr:hypothetical protein [Cyanobacteriota bacterium]
MATINISNLSPTGAELFGDSESFLNDLLDDDMIFGEGERWFWSSYCHRNNGREGEALWTVYQWDPC